MHAKVRTMEKLSSHNTAGLLYLSVTTGYTTATKKKMPGHAQTGNAARRGHSSPVQHGVS